MDTKNKFSWAAFELMPVIGIIRNLSSEIIKKIAPIFQQSGLTTLEITMTSEYASQIIKSLSVQYPELNIGAGTVCEMEDLHVAIESGASFIVTPILNEDVVSYCVKNSIPVFPGAFTPTEIYKAWKLGASAVKVFPATQLGPSYLKELKGPLSQIRLLPTGGVSLENIESFLEAGAVGVGMGSSLFDKGMISRQDFESLYLRFKETCSRVGRTVMHTRI